MRCSKVSLYASSQPRLPPELQPSTAKALTQQAVLFAGGVATFAGLYEWATPFITWATSIAPAYVMPTRAGAAAAIGAFGGAAAVLMESTYDTVSAACVAAKHDSGLSFDEALQRAVTRQREQMPSELRQDTATAGGSGAILGALASFFPDTVIWASFSAVAIALAYGVGSFVLEVSDAVRALRRAKRLDKQGETDQAHGQRREGHERLRVAGRAALESAAVAAVVTQIIGPVGHVFGHTTIGHDPVKAGQIVSTAADQIPSAVESIAEVAEAVRVSVRESHEAVHRLFRPGARRRRSDTTAA